MKQMTGIYNLSHIGFANIMGRIPGRNTGRNLNRMLHLTIPVFRSTAFEKEKNNLVFFLKYPGFRHEKERFFSKIDGFSLERVKYLQKTGKNEHESIRRFFKRAGYAPETLEKSPKTLRTISETLQNISEIPGNLSTIHRNLLDRRSKLPEKHYVDMVIREKSSRTLCDRPGGDEKSPKTHEN